MSDIRTACDGDSLTNVLSYLNEPWKLKVTKKGIERSGWLEQIFFRIAAFFSNFHKTDLKNKVVTILAEQQKSPPQDDHAKNQLEKLSRVIHLGRDSWLYGLKNQKQIPSIATVTMDPLEEDPSKMQPTKDKHGRFVNYDGESPWKQFAETMRLLFPGACSAATRLKDVESLCDRSPVISRSEEPQMTWVGHSTVLFQLGGMNILSDPAFSFVPPCFIRHTQPGIRLEDLPLLDGVVISHNHQDHCQPSAIKHFSHLKPTMFVPQDFKPWMLEKGFDSSNVCEMKWWQKAHLEKDGKKIEITAVPAKHNSQTSLSDINKSHWVGYVIEYDGFKIYFAGDTAKVDGLADQLRDEFGTFDLVCLPVAPEEEHPVHLDNRQALEFFRELDAKLLLPIHWGAYRQSKETLEAPKDRLEKFLLGEFKDLEGKVLLPKIGQRLDLKQLASREQESERVA